MEPSSSNSKSHSPVDRLGAVASSACAIHCALCALLPATLATLGLSFLISHELEWALTGFAVALGLFAIFQAWRRHGNVLVLATLSIGVIGLLAARGLEAGGHHGHHEEEGHAAAEKTAHGAEETEAGHAAGEKKEDHAEEGEAGHHGEGHMAGELLGVFAGLILCAGHLINLREWRKTDTCDAAESGVST